MSTAAATGISWDPYRQDLAQNPYPTYKRLREEMPLYYNEEHDFYAISRFADVESTLRDRDLFSSAHGDILEFIKAKSVMPDSVFIHQDPPKHTAYRALMQRIITPKRMNALEQQIRALCARSIDPHVDTGRFDFITNLGAEMPMRVIGMLLGIPESDQEAVRREAREETGLHVTVGLRVTDESGGITTDTATITVANVAEVCAAGANVIVSGSGVYGTKDYAATITEMRSKGEAARA